MYVTLAMYALLQSASSLLALALSGCSVGKQDRVIAATHVPRITPMQVFLCDVIRVYENGLKTDTERSIVTRHTL